MPIFEHIYLPTSSPEDVSKFRVLYEEKYGKTLSDAKAQELCANLVQFVWLCGGTGLKPEKDRAGEPLTFARRLLESDISNLFH